MRLIMDFNNNDNQVNTVKPHTTAVYRSGRSPRARLSDWALLLFSRDMYAAVSNRISTERASASSAFCRSSRNTVQITAMSNRVAHRTLGKQD